MKKIGIWTFKTVWGFFRKGPSIHCDDRAILKSRINRKDRPLQFRLLNSSHELKERAESNGWLDPDLDIGTATEHYLNDAWATHQGKLGTDTTYSAPFESIKQKMALQENNARLRQLYPGASQQPTPLQVAATPLQQAFKTNPEVGKQQFDKEILPHLPTKGMKEPITTSVDNGQLIIHVPRKKTSLTSGIDSHDIMIPIDDPNFGSVLQTKLQQEGMNVSDFNQSYKGGKVKTPVVNNPKKKNDKDPLGLFN